ncbi:MAG: protein translocase subunit SecD [Bacteroidota bacterium]|nr:protein translocase subunit SecD [Candidatus Kapabacteria bacterium]MCS7302928.1 protein translocase subunit SecD [Candidatus Kapabacteria bacterium]MCX7937433.1 protein translocase subunit SecD [Chlorobiota bacterium]MDW8075793.1 protein translocase subunit SecD [Bacteroidota bacterium]MDW8272472.1 protein translocase subunit SecD [Bacteroidota bacterium]
MKGKVGKLLTVIVPIVLAVFLLYPTWRAQQMAAERAALDSAAQIQWDQTYGEEFRKEKLRALKLGLDLRGGMYVTLEVDVVRLLEEAADRASVDETFERVIEETRRQAEQSDEDVLDIFLRTFDQIARPQGKSLVTYYELVDVRDISEERIVDRLKRDINEAIDQALEVIRQRIDKFGVTEPTIQKQGTRRILLELPGVQDEREMRQLLQTTARLEFKLLRRGNDVLYAFLNIDRYLAGKTAPSSTDTAAAKPADTTASVAPRADTATAAQRTDTAKKDPYAGLSDEEKVAKFRREHPFLSLFVGQVLIGERYQPFDIAEEVIPKLPSDAEFYFLTNEDNKRQLQALLARPDIRRMLPADAEIAFSAKPERGTENTPNRTYAMYVLKRDPELTGDVVTDAYATFDQMTNRPMVLMYMNSEGAERWAKITGANIGKRIAIVLDGEVYSAPVVRSKITGGSSQIEGMANVEEAKLLQIVLKAGALKAPVKIIEERVVGPSLGEDSIRSGISASMIAFALVVLFMVTYYSMGGVVAVIAMLINVMLNLGVLAGFGGTLTLPGIAGIILTLAIAVDANIIIFERIREELHRGRSLRASIDEGFRHALPPIIDSHATTFLTGLILFVLGYGPIQGFATTLMIGILSTLFTSIIVSRAIIDLWLARSPQARISFGEVLPATQG